MLTEVCQGSLLRAIDLTAPLVMAHWPSSASVFARERAEQSAVAGDWHGEPIDFADGAVRAWLLSALEHLDALASHLGDPPNLFASSSIARGAMEASGRAAWLADPKVGVRVRAARLMTEVLHANHHERLLPAEGETTQGIPSAVVESNALALGFRVVRPSGRYSAPYVEEPRPGATQLMVSMLGSDAGRLTYGSLSAGVHSSITSVCAGMHGWINLRTSGEPEALANIDRAMTLGPQGALATLGVAIETAAEWWDLYERGEWRKQYRAMQRALLDSVARAHGEVDGSPSQLGERADG